jgi:hypothetical protein
MDDRPTLDDTESGDMQPLSDVDVFISHSTRDRVLARALVNLVRSSLSLGSERIRCTSVDGFRLPIGISIAQQLRAEIHQSKAFVALITPSSIKSEYVLFEIGARWGANKALLPLLAKGVLATHLKGPLSTINALACDQPAELHQFVQDLARTLQLQADRPSALHSSIEEVASLSRAGRSTESLAETDEFSSVPLASRGGDIADQLQVGWHGLAWASTLEEFRRRFPRCSKDRGGGMLTGEEAETFCDLRGLMRYFFNEKDELYMFVHLPEDRESMPARLLDAFGPPEGGALAWTLGEIEVTDRAGLMVTVERVQRP